MFSLGEYLFSCLVDYLHDSVLNIVDVCHLANFLRLLSKRERNLDTPFMDILQKLLNHLTVANSDMWPLLISLLGFYEIFLTENLEYL